MALRLANGSKTQYYANALSLPCTDITLLDHL